MEVPVCFPYKKSYFSVFYLSKKKATKSILSLSEKADLRGRLFIILNNVFKYQETRGFSLKFRKDILGS